MVHQKKGGLTVFSPILDRFSRIPTKSVLFATSFTAVLCWLAVCMISRNPGTHALPQVFFCAFVMLGCALIVLARFHREHQRIPLGWIFTTAIILRLISLTGEPLFEDDYFRYLWDGYQTVATKDPYSLAPEVFFDRDVPEQFEPVLSLINYPEIATVYGPVTQWFFAAGYLLDPASVRPLQILSAIADLLIMLILVKLGARNALLLYAWSPLMLKEFSLTAHPDIFAILFMLASVYAMHSRKVVLAGIALALAFGAKVFAILAIPFLLTSGWQQDLSIKSLMRTSCILGATFLATLGAITLWYGTAAIWIPEGLRAMADNWLFNAPLYLLLLSHFEFNTIKLILLSAFTVYLVVVFIRRIVKDHVNTRSTDVVIDIASDVAVKGIKTTEWCNSNSAFRGDWLYLLFLLSLPVINPWYVAWIIPFATLYPTGWAWAASLMVLLSYWYGSYVAASGGDALQLPVAVIAIEYAVVIGVAAIAWGLGRYLTSNNPDQ